jgi:hypothetical protein
MHTPVAPAFIRGTTVADELVTFAARSGDPGFRAPDPSSFVGSLPLRDPRLLADVHELAFEEIVGYLDELGRRLRLSENEHLQEAVDASVQWADMTPPLIRASFEQLPMLFEADAIREMADAAVGIPFLEGWMQRRMADGRLASVRAMGARTVHIVAGNSPLISALSIIRNAIVRSDAIVKSPSNDPLTALAIARTMGEMAPDHPITRHISVAYWKGGDAEIEGRLYQPGLVEKIVAWGGFASVKHVAQYIQPGLELISLDPKRSATIIGPEAFRSPATTSEVALRAAVDVGALNQLGCVNARVIFVAAEVDRVNLLGEQIYERLLRLPARVSTSAKRFDPELRAAVDALRSSPEWYRVYGGAHGEGAVIVSQLDEPVEFHRSLSGRVANVVPVADPHDAIRWISASTQTVGVYPDSLKLRLRDLLPLHGAQRLVSLGYAADPSVAMPQDAIEPMRRMAKWIVDETCEPGDLAPLWLETEEEKEEEWLSSSTRLMS